MQRLYQTGGPNESRPVRIHRADAEATRNNRGIEEKIRDNTESKGER